MGADSRLKRNRILDLHSVWEDEMNGNKYLMRWLMALLLTLLLLCVAAAVDAQESPQSGVTKEVEWYLYRGYLIDPVTQIPQGRYIISQVPGDRQSKSGFVILTLITFDGAWLVTGFRAGMARPKWQTVPAIGVTGFTRWWPGGGELVLGDLKWTLVVRGVLEEVQ